MYCSVIIFQVRLKKNLLESLNVVGKLWQDWIIEIKFPHVSYFERLIEIVQLSIENESWDSFGWESNLKYAKQLNSNESYEIASSLTAFQTIVSSAGQD